MLPTHVQLVDVGPRDGLQNEAQPVAAAHKIELVHRLQAAGLKQIEVTSFVSPKWVPQMGDNSEVMAGIQRQPDVRYSVLTPNMKGFEGAIAAKADEVVIFAAASEAFSQRNINCSIAESIERFRPVAQAAREHGLRVRAAVSCALGCPYEGDIAIDKVVDVARRLLDIGSDHIGIADTIGVGTAGRVSAVMEATLKHVPLAELSGHFHDTYGQALANIYASLLEGIQVFDSSVAGLGGCPYAKGASGNVASEDVLYLLDGLGIHTGIDLDALIAAGERICAVLGRDNGSRVTRARRASA
jgi:hydroxymethylglutaryl-CoA lyase